MSEPYRHCEIDERLIAIAKNPFTITRKPAGLAAGPIDF
jgi:hypothetical protein